MTTTAKRSEYEPNSDLDHDGLPRDRHTVFFLERFDGDVTSQYAMRVQIPGESLFTRVVF